MHEDRAEHRALQLAFCWMTLVDWQARPVYPHYRFVLIRTEGAGVKARMRATIARYTAIIGKGKQGNRNMIETNAIVVSSN